MDETRQANSSGADGRNERTHEQQNVSSESTDAAECKMAKHAPPPKPVRSSLVNKDSKSDSDVVQKVASEATSSKPLNKRSYNSGETENEADISSLSSLDEIEENLATKSAEAIMLPPQSGYKRLQSVGGDTSGGEEIDQATVSVDQLRLQEKTCETCSSETEKLESLALQPLSFSQEFIKSPALSELSGPGAILDLSGEVKEPQFSENGYLAGLEMHEFHSSSAPSVSCELRLDSFGGRERGRSVAEVKELAFARLQEELQKAQDELKLKDEEVVRLSRIRDEVLAELEELTASLFQEAHEMVREANVKQAFAQKALKEANMKIEVLQAELKALKALVITSTPSMPNRHLHPHLDPKKDSSSPPNNGINFLRGHKRSPSHNNLKYGRDPTPPPSPEKGENPALMPFCPENYEIDPIYHREFVSWRESPGLDKSHPFLIRIYQEDIEPCLNFTNRELSCKVQACVENNSITIEAVSGKSSFPKRCALSEAPRLCKYRMRLSEEEQWFYISQLCRNRIAAVCDFLSYLRYIQQGLVRSGVNLELWMCREPCDRALTLEYFSSNSH